VPPEEPTGPGFPVYEETIAWTNNHGGHTDEQYCWYEIEAYSRDDSTWGLIKEGSTWSGSATNATESVTVSNPARADDSTSYSKYRIRINNKRMSCDTSNLKYSSYTSELNTSISTNPCD
jgi:hypothetical protein